MIDIDMKFCHGPSSTIGSEPNAGPGVMSLIPARSHTFLGIDHERFSTVILLLPLIQEGLVSVTIESMCRKN